MEPPARIPGRRRGAGLDHRRLSGLRPDDAERREARERARPVEALGRDHDDRPADARAEGVSGFFPGYWDSRGWGFGVSMVTRRDDVAAVPGRYGWDGGYGTSWSSDPKEDMVAILMTQRLAFPLSSGIYLDFWTSAYQTIDY